MAEFGTSQVHPNHDEDKEEEVCEVVEEILEDPSGQLEVNASFRGSELHDADRQPPLEPVAFSATELPPDDINGPDTNTIEVPYQPPPQQPVRAPVVVDEGLEANIKAEDHPITPPNPDKCCVFLCCGFPNGASSIVCAQFFLALGLMLSGWAMVDCRFIDATAGYPDLYYPPGVTPPANATFSPDERTRRGFGMFLNETRSGGCFSERNVRDMSVEEVENYADFLGSDWNLPRNLGATAISMGWTAWLTLLLFMCCSCVRSIRLLYAAFLFLVVAGFQSSTFSVLGSSFCQEEDANANCQPARGFWFMVAGVACYVIASLSMALSKDFPGSVRY